MVSGSLLPGGKMLQHLALVKLLPSQILSVNGSHVMVFGLFASNSEATRKQNTSKFITVPSK
jgi:hypothetical protein